MKEQYIKGFLDSLQVGTVAIPQLLIKYYHQLKLSDMEAMLLIHIITFKQREQKDFPTIEEIQSRMTSDPSAVIDTLQKLMKEGFLTIDEEIDPESGIQYENYNLVQTFEKLADCCSNELTASNTNSTGSGQPSGQGQSPMKESKDIYSVFEKEFARPLSPMECETISSWIDQDKYNQELILAALKEAVFAGKLHFRYIDRILLEWSRNRVFTVEQAKEFAQKFRGTR